VDINTSLDREKFILMIAHSRSGGTLCTGLLNKSPDLNIGGEVGNNFLRQDLFKASLEGPFLFPDKFNGNKVVIHSDITEKIFIESLKKRLFIVHKNWKKLKVIFTKRDHVSTMVSQYRRLENRSRKSSIQILSENSLPNRGLKGLENSSLQIKKICEEYYASEIVIKKLKLFFRDYFTFEFENAVRFELIRKSLFDYVGVRYYGIYSDTYGGQRNYRTGNEIRPENICFGRKDLDLKLRKKFENYIHATGLYPWKCISEKEFEETYDWRI